VIQQKTTDMYLRDLSLASVLQKTYCSSNWTKFGRILL